MSTTALTQTRPVVVANRDLDGDEVYFAKRQGGITATEIREWQSPSKRRAIITEKVTGDRDGSEYVVRAFEHGKYREPFISEWAAATHGVVHTTSLYAHGENPRHLCTPDGYLAGFSLEYEPGAEGVIVEVKTTTKDLTPGVLDAAHVLVAYDPKSHFHKMKYLRQVQWQMYVMNAARCLFIWEPYDHDRRDPETGHYIVTGPPQWCIIPRDQAMINALVAEANAGLELIDKARATGLPPVADIPIDEAILLNDLFEARDALAIAEAQRKKAWEALDVLYAERGEFSEDRGFASVSRTVPTVGKPVNRFDRDAAAKRAPKKLAEYEAFVARYTVTEFGQPGSPRLTINDRRGKE